MSRDMRKYSRNTTIQLIIGGLLLIFIIGDGLIYIFQGPSAALSGLLCLAAGLVPILIIIGIMALIGWIVKRYDGD
jgi:hypothetical protein